jgi:hypothetical protein
MDKVSPAMTAATGVANAAAGTATTLTSAASQVSQVANNVTNATKLYPVPRMIHTKAVPIMMHPQSRLNAWMASVQGLPVSAQSDRALEWFAKEIEGTAQDLFTMTGEWTPENFKLAARGFISGTVSLCSKALDETPLGIIHELDPLFWDKVQTHLINVVMKLDQRKLFSQEELVKIVEANIRLTQRMAFLN